MLFLLAELYFCCLFGDFPGTLDDANRFIEESTRDTINQIIQEQIVDDPQIAKEPVIELGKYLFFFSRRADFKIYLNLFLKRQSIFFFDAQDRFDMIFSNILHSNMNWHT